MKIKTWAESRDVESKIDEIMLGMFDKSKVVTLENLLSEQDKLNEYLEAITEFSANAVPKLAFSNDTQ